MVLEGFVTNVAAFGAFVDVGVQDPCHNCEARRCCSCQGVGGRPKTPSVSLTMRGSMKLWKRGRPQHAQKSPQRDRRNASDPPRCVQAKAIPGPSAAMRWLRRFGERGRRAGPQGGHSATGL
jgi:hypothetical protein